ncbi:hydroxyacylglutathione hydrolase [Neokomagataea thailandica NBRC 106555]|uniref:Hydroxyacylglutathione hydrolase n=2 Tax=Neokomagataea TaxID=1223423 RepID=A0A4Y6V204_9PROT|nr:MULTISPECIES: hydroxyacylglutathione hydrolase [Neokomagataea]QDH24082.1 hydroxyacylglutathione hydrolase [Neokomagataea tanensis]GBR50336.1 hydroxyacylglutathione hydrolase [Neokomagataea thailandica NBRC 106555]
MSYQVQAIPVLSDNYAWLVTCPGGERILVDPGCAEDCMKVLDEGRLDWILLTHHHADHTGGTDILRERYGAEVIGAGTARMPQLDREVRGGDVFDCGLSVQVFATPGHAIGHVSYFMPQIPALFCGDVLFSVGCGRLLEGSADELFKSIRLFDALPDETLLCAGHEYTESNIRFARQIEPENAALKAYESSVFALRTEGRPSLPTYLGLERQVNPFLRAPTVESFAELRRAKDAS